MTPAATSGVDGVLGGRELEPGAALYLCGPAIAQQKRHRPECGHRLEALGATDYVRIRWYGTGATAPGYRLVACGIDWAFGLP